MAFRFELDLHTSGKPLERLDVGAGLDLSAAFIVVVAPKLQGFSAQIWLQYGLTTTSHEGQIHANAEIFLGVPGSASRGAGTATHIVRHWGQTGTEIIMERPSASPQRASGSAGRAPG